MRGGLEFNKIVTCFLYAWCIFSLLERELRIYLFYITGELGMSIMTRLLFFCGTAFLVCIPTSRTQERFMFDGRPFGCDQTTVQELEYFETEHHTCISVLQDKSGKKFIVKQDTRGGLFRHLSVARDRLGAFIAESIGVPANQVTIIPAYCDFPGKRLAVAGFLAFIRARSDG